MNEEEKFINPSNNDIMHVLKKKKKISETHFYKGRKDRPINKSFNRKVQTPIKYLSRALRPKCLYIIALAPRERSSNSVIDTSTQIETVIFFNFFHK